MVLVVLLLAAAGCGSNDSNSSSRTKPSSDTQPESRSSPTADWSDEDLAAAAEATRQDNAEGLRSSAKRFVANFYDDLDARQYQGAWRRLSPDLRSEMGTFQSWRDGYHSTLNSEVSNVSVEMTSDTTAAVSATLRAADVDACADTVRRRFAVTWTLARSGDRWKGEKVDAKKVAGHEPTTEFADCEASGGEDGPSSRSGAGGPSDQIEDPDSEPLYLGSEEDPCIDSCSGPGPVGNGYPTRCADGAISHSGGRPGACSHHGGVAGGSSAGAGSLPSTGSSSSSSGAGSVQVDGYFRKDGTYVAPHTRRSPRR